MDRVDGIIWARAIISTATTTDLVNPAATRRVKLHDIKVFCSVAGAAASTFALRFETGPVIFFPAAAVLLASVGLKLDLDLGAKGLNLGSVGDDLEIVTTGAPAATITVDYAYSLEGA